MSCVVWVLDRRVAARYLFIEGQPQRPFLRPHAAPARPRAPDLPRDLCEAVREGQKNDYNDAQAIAEAAVRPNLRTVREKTQDQLNLQACHRVRSRLVSRRTATISQIRAFLIERGIAVRTATPSPPNTRVVGSSIRGPDISDIGQDLLYVKALDWLQSRPSGNLP